MKKKRSFPQQKVSLGIVAVLFGVVGLYFTFLSSAATPTASVEPETGTVASPAVVTADGGASGGQAVKFMDNNTNGLPLPDWSDEFNGNALSYATDNGGGTWRTKGYEAGNDLNNGYVDFVANSWNATPDQAQKFGIVTVANGALTIKAKRVNTLNNPGNTGGVAWMGAYLVTNHKTNLRWRYGYFEWRMRDPNPVRGMFPTLFMFNNIEGRGDGYEGAEMDMIEIFGSRTGMPWYAGVHFNPSKLNGKEGQNVSTLGTDTANWHRYSINWTPNLITYARDGTTIGTLSGAEAAWYQHADMGIRINYSMDPKWLGGTEFYSTPNDPAPGTEPRTEVDYVRHYNQKPANLPGGTEDPY